MQYCTKCGAQLVDEAVVCTGCGRAVEGKITVAPKKSASALAIVAMVLMIVSSATWGLFPYGIPLLWRLPLAIVTCIKILKGDRIPAALKVFVMLLVSPVGGILLLCDKD